MQNAIDLATKAYKYGIDAIIVQDLGIINNIDIIYENDYISKIQVKKSESTSYMIETISGFETIKNLNLDLMRGYTSEGPQREDFEILINEKSDPATTSIHYGRHSYFWPWSA